MQRNVQSKKQASGIDAYIAAFALFNLRKNIFKNENYSLNIAVFAHARMQHAICYIIQYHTGVSTIMPSIDQLTDKERFREESKGVDYSTHTLKKETSSQLETHSHFDAFLVYVQAAAYTWVFMRQVQPGLYYLAQHAADAGYKVRVDSLSANDHLVKRLSRILIEHSCNILGLYVDQDNQWDLRRILAILKERLPHLQIIIGGPQVTADPEETLSRLPEATCGVIGEGEETFVELLALPSLNFAELATCRGLIIKNDKNMVRTPPRPPIEPLDRLSIPQRKGLYFDKEFSFHPTMITGRGCPGRCAYCFEGRVGNGGRRLRQHSSQRCLEEFDYLVRESTSKYICILDNTFTANHKRLREFCNGLIKKYRGEMKWFCEARVDSLVRHPDLLPLMIEAGLLRLQLGGESGCQHILDIYRKGTTLDQMIAVVESAKTNGLLSIYVNFIVGGAYETQETYRQTKDFALGLLEQSPGCVAVGSSFYTPYPGTAMYENPEEFGIKVIDSEVVTGMGDDFVFCRTKELSRLDILSLGHDFKKSIREKMEDLSKQLPFEVIEKHFQAYYDWGLSTEWYETLSANISVYSYFRSIYHAGVKSFAQAAERNFINMYPLRNVELVASRENRYLIRLPNGSVREMDELESTILEFSSGKLKFDDIVDIISAQVPDFGMTIRQAIIERYASFDKQFLVVWKTDE